jgi:hypothetical protein
MLGRNAEYGWGVPIAEGTSEGGVSGMVTGWAVARADHGLDGDREERPFATQTVDRTERSLESVAGPAILRGAACPKRFLMPRCPGGNRWRLPADSRKMTLAGSRLDTVSTVAIGR